MLRLRWTRLLQGLELDLGADDGEEGVDAGAFGEGEERGDDLVDGVALDDAAAVQAGDGAAAGVEEAEVVVDLGGGGDGGAGVAGLVFLLDGDGGGEAVHVVDVGLFDALEELAGVGGEGFDVAALAFGVDGVEGERGFAGAGDAGDDGEGVVRDVDVDALEVVGAGAADGDLVDVIERLGVASVHQLRSWPLLLSEDPCEWPLRLVRWLVAEDFEEEEAGADDDAGVGDVEVGPVVVDDVDFEEVDDVVVDDAVVEVADGSAEDEGEGDAGEREARPTRQSMPSTTMTAMTEKAMRTLRTGAGRRFGEHAEGGAGVVDVEIRKTPGMTVMGWPRGTCAVDESLVRRSRTMTSGGDEEQQGRTVAVRRRL